MYKLIDGLLIGKGLDPHKGKRKTSPSVLKNVKPLLYTIDDRLKQMLRERDRQKSGLSRNGHLR